MDNLIESKRQRKLNESIHMQMNDFQKKCFLVDDMPYEIEIIPDYEAIIRGENPEIYLQELQDIIIQLLPFDGRYISLADIPAYTMLL